MRSTEISKWITVTLRDDQNLDHIAIESRSHSNKSFTLGKIYNARLKMYKDNNFISGLFVMLEEPEKFDRIIRLYKQFSVDLSYPSVQSFLASWNIIDRHVLIEKTGHCL